MRSREQWIWGTLAASAAKSLALLQFMSDLASAIRFKQLVNPSAFANYGKLAATILRQFGVPPAE